MNKYQLTRLIASTTALTSLLYCNYTILKSVSSHEGGNNVPIVLAQEEYNDTSDTTKLANEQSYGFFHDIPTEEWELHQLVASKYEKFRNPDDPLEFVPGRAKNTRWSAFNSAEAFYGSNYEPNFSCAFERRIGGNGNGDGPKWVSKK